MRNQTFHSSAGRGGAGGGTHLQSVGLNPSPSDSEAQTSKPGETQRTWFSVTAQSPKTTSVTTVGLCQCPYLFCSKDSYRPEPFVFPAVLTLIPLNKLTLPSCRTCPEQVHVPIKTETGETAQQEGRRH